MLTVDGVNTDLQALAASGLVTLMVNGSVDLGLNVGQGQLALTAVPLPLPVVLLGSALAWVVVVRRRADARDGRIG